VCRAIQQSSHFRRALWDARSMGNKDAKKREIRKPKKKPEKVVVTPQR
jgi:hypothetical protein